MGARQSIIRRFLIFLYAMSLSACMVGPDFHTPPPPDVKRLTEIPLPKKTVHSQSAGGHAQRFVNNEDIPLLWWELFHSPQINQLIQTGLANSPSLASAIAALQQAQENVNIQIGSAFLPNIQTINTAQRQRYSLVAIGVDNREFTFNLVNPTLTISYTFDVFGGARRELESLRAQVDYQQFQLIAAYMTLTANIVTSAINIASYQDQIQATDELIHVEQNVLNILNQQYRLGGISEADVLTQKTTLEQTKASLPPLQKSLAQAQHTLSALVGAFPDGPLPQINLNALHLPENIPVSLPSNLVKQRPDIRASEALIHAACAQIGVATANLLPQFTITGAYGWINTSFLNLFTPHNLVWDGLIQVSQTIFKGGALFAARRGKIDAFKQAEAQYRQTVLNAFRNVADTLRALETDARTLQAQARAEQAASKALKLTLSQYRLGGTTYINLLNAQHQYQQAMINRIQAQAVRLNDTVALFQSLGGGWWNKPGCQQECLS